MANNQPFLEIVEKICLVENGEMLHAKNPDDGTHYLLRRMQLPVADESRRMDFEVRIRREIENVENLEHPAIMRPLQVRREKGHIDLVYSFCKGVTLQSMLRKAACFSPEDAVRFVLPIVQGLEYVHAKGIVLCGPHDAGIFMDELLQPRIFDFMHARAPQEDGAPTEGAVCGVFPWLSAEQTGFSDIALDFRADLYCACLLLYRLCSGPLPFLAKDIGELTRSVLTQQVKPIGNAPLLFNALILKGLSPDPVDRYQTAAGLLYDLGRLVRILTGTPTNQFAIGEKDSMIAINRKRMFVGRENELAYLNRGLVRTKQLLTSSFLIYGPSGIGKTEIARMFLRHIDDNEFIVLSGKCSRMTVSQPYTLFRFLMLELMQKLTNDCRRALIQQAFKNELGDQSGIICQLIPEIKGLFLQIGEAQIIEKDKEADRMVHVLSQAVVTITKIVPLVFFIDDFQWVDAISLAIIRKLSEAQPGSLIILNFRTTGTSLDVKVFDIDLKNIGIKNTLAVLPFTKEEIGTFLGSWFETIENKSVLIDLLEKRTGGNPLVLCEACKFMVNRSIIKVIDRTWTFEEKNIALLPEKFDFVSLMLENVKMLDERKQKYLDIAALIEGGIDKDVVENVGRFSADESKTFLVEFENLGLVTDRFKAGYTFSHDKIQEGIADRIPQTEKLVLYGLLAVVYESKIKVDKENIFRVADYYLKCENRNKTIETSFEAAQYATEKIAFDVAIRYFKHVAQVVENVIRSEMPGNFDLIKFNMAFGEVLMLMGANKKAIEVLEKLLGGFKLEAFQKLEIQYKIGTIYHNIGEYEISAPYFIDALREMGIKIPNKRVWVIAIILFEIIKQILFSSGIKKLIKKNNDTYTLLKIRILNKLSYSLYFSDMFLCFLAHFKSINMADLINDNFEKAEAYTIHQVPIYQIFFKKRSFKYLKKACKISENVNRQDSLAFAQSFGGAIHYYIAKWKIGEDILNSSNSHYENIGDITGQLQNYKHLWKINMMKGYYNEKTNQYINKTIELSKKINERFYHVVALSALNLLKLLRTGLHNTFEFDEIENKLRDVKSFLFKVEVDYYVLNTEILLGKFESAYTRAKNLLPLTLTKSVNSEYQVGSYSLFCYLINKELLSRCKNNLQINATSFTLKKYFVFYSLILWFSCLSYPAYWGSFYRNIAWFMALLKRKKLSHWFFKKAIKKHHDLDMRYEEACSIRDYGVFLEEFCNKPGVARDLFAKAYDLFAQCGSKFDLDAMDAKGYVSKSFAAHAPSEGDGLPSTSEVISTTSSDVSQVRIRTLLDTCASMTEIHDVKRLLRQILSAMIKATGAQFGCLFLEGRQEKTNTLFLDHTGRVLSEKETGYSQKILEEISETNKAGNIRDVVEVVNSEKNTIAGFEQEQVRSVICVPLFRLDVYLGFVYLGNNLVSDLFSSSSKNAAKILAVQASILIENAYLFSEYQNLSNNLKQCVQAQTLDIRNKNRQLEKNTLKLLDSERMKGLLTGALIHDIKNYIFGIVADIEIMDRSDEDNVPIPRLIDRIRGSSNAIANLTINMLDIGKMEEGKIPIERKLLTFEKLDTMIQGFRDILGFDRKKIFVEIQKPLKSFSIDADEYLCERVFQNLLSNALKYTGENGKVLISFETLEKENRISVFNSGMPIPIKYATMLFDKYSRIDNKSSTYSKGLGLFFCNMVMNAHDGKIWLETNSTGNTFIMSFKK